MEDLEVLPTDKIVSEYEDALRAIDLLLSARFTSLGWESRVEYWEEFVRDAATFCCETINEDYRRWTENSASAGTTLCLCVAATSLEKHEWHRL